FFLFPTFFHEQVEKARRTKILPSRPDEGKIELKFFAKVERAQAITSWDRLEMLVPFHFWRESIVRERFEYDPPGELHIALVRIFRVEPKWVLPNEKKYGGCRSWVRLPVCPPWTQFLSVLND